MPFFPPLPPSNTDHAATHARKQAVVAPSTTKNGEARTLLPMTGNSTVGKTSTAGAATMKVVTNQGSTSKQGTQGTVKILIPNDANEAQSSAKTNFKGAAAAGSNKVKYVHETYFDAGAQDLIGTFTTQIIRYGVRYQQHEIHVYGRNETLDTRGTNLPYQSIVAGTSVGAAYRYWFPGNRLFATVSDGQFLSGNNKGKSDFRFGLAGYYDWRSEKMFTDIYGDLFYIDIQKDTFATARIRSGMILNKVAGGPLTGYGVFQVFNSGKGDSGTTNRVEGGFGVGYTYGGKISLNVEMRAGYAYRGIINNRTYLNPMIVLSGSL